MTTLREELHLFVTSQRLRWLQRRLLGQPGARSARGCNQAKFVFVYIDNEGGPVGVPILYPRRGVFRDLIFPAVVNRNNSMFILLFNTAS